MSLKYERWIMCSYGPCDSVAQWYCNCGKLHPDEFHEEIIPDLYAEMDTVDHLRFACDGHRSWEGAPDAHRR